MHHWLFDCKKLVFVVHINGAYHEFVEDKTWLVKKVLDTQHITQCVNGVQQASIH